MEEAVRKLEVDLPVTKQAAAAARRLVRQFLASWSNGRLEDDAGIVVSELVTNAVQHAAGGQLRLDVWFDRRGCLRIAVDDSSAKLPVMREPAFDAEAGRGLLIVQQLSTRWGVDMHPGSGKRVWAELG